VLPKPHPTVAPTPFSFVSQPYTVATTCLDCVCIFVVCVSERIGLGYGPAIEVGGGRRFLILFFFPARFVLDVGGDGGEEG